MNDYDTLAEVQTSVRQFIDEVYNRKRLHSALGYMPPAEFEEELLQTHCLNFCVIWGSLQGIRACYANWFSPLAGSRSCRSCPYAG